MWSVPRRTNTHFRIRNAYNREAPPNTVPHARRRWVLLGRLMSNSRDIIVDAATEPTTLDRAGRFFFQRSRRPTQKAIDEAWRNSDGTRNYLGEWHTHPEANPTPSEHDRAQWQLLCETARFEQNFLLFLILGQRSIGLWELFRENQSVLQCMIEAAQ